MRSKDAHKQLARTSLNSVQAGAQSFNSSLSSKYFSLSCILATTDKMFKTFRFLSYLRAVSQRIGKYAKVARKYYGVNFG